MYLSDPTIEMRIADLVSRYAELDCNDIRTAMTDACCCGDRKLRYLAEYYRLRKQKNGHYPTAYEYRDGWYWFTPGFQRFCGSWLRGQVKDRAKKHDRVAA